MLQKSRALMRCQRRKRSTKECTKTPATGTRQGAQVPCKTSASTRPPRRTRAPPYRNPSSEKLSNTRGGGNARELSLEKTDAFVCIKEGKLELRPVCLYNIILIVLTHSEARVAIGIRLTGKDTGQSRKARIPLLANFEGWFFVRKRVTEDFLRVSGLCELDDSPSLDDP